ncbi:MAG: hypothetical protein HRU76_00055 [Phycisphaeraceae bacterium]|nr:hypothetical protein [Phycisphaerales bacterium]QOJ16085.1 MAG: hypothetical protein HRU76_00055 [Phycisphaeraceae bacterium]
MTSNENSIDGTYERPGLPPIGSHLVTTTGPNGERIVLYRPPTTEAERRALYGPGNVEAAKRGKATWKACGCGCDVQTGACHCTTPKPAPSGQAVTARTMPRAASDVDDLAEHPALAGTAPVRFSEAHAAREAAHARAVERFHAEGAYGDIARFDAILNEELSRRA